MSKMNVDLSDINSNIDKVLVLEELGADNDEIADRVDVKRNTIYDYKDKYSIDGRGIDVSNYSVENDVESDAENVENNVESDAENRGDISKSDMEVGNPLVEQLDDEPAQIYECAECGCEIDYLGNDCKNEDCSGMDNSDWINTKGD